MQTRNVLKVAPMEDLPISPRKVMAFLLSCLIVAVWAAHASADLRYTLCDRTDFEVPGESRVEVEAKLRAEYEGHSGYPLKSPPVQGTAGLTFGEPVRVGGPIWAHVEPPNNFHGMVQYPIGVEPDNLGCHEFEVRRNGVLLPRIVVRYSIRVTGGLSCGVIGIPGRPMKHPGRLPLHLQYRFETPGVYEVCYARKADQFGPRSAEILFRSAWTRVEVQPAAPAPIGSPPQDPVEILSDFLPSILGVPDSERLSVVLDYLYHPEETVRRYAANSLGYWPDNEVQSRLISLARAKGPSDVVIDRTLSTAPELAEAMLGHLNSDNPVIVRGAVTAASRVVSNHQRLFTSGAQARAGDALIAAAEHVVRVGDGQTINNFAVTLGALRDERSNKILWDFVRRRAAYQQSLIAITMRKDLKDLPGLVEILDAPATGDPLSGELSSLPYALRNAYGAAALPALEDALKKSGYVWVRTSCARELIIENRPSGFAFVADAIEQDRFYKREMIEFLLGRFPELRGAGDAAVLAFLKRRTV